MEAYIHIGNESVIAPDYIVNELILKGTHQSFDSLITNEKNPTTVSLFWKPLTGNVPETVLIRPIIFPSG